jgi:hypothetical protein
MWKVLFCSTLNALAPPRLSTDGGKYDPQR